MAGGTYTLSYSPTEKQRMFHESTADRVLYGGAAGGGKSYAMCWDALLRCLRWKGTSAYMFRRTYPMLESTLIKTMMRIVPKGIGRYVGDRHEYQLINGSIIKFCYCDNEGSDLMNYQGAEIDWLYFDELTHFTQGMYDFIVTRLRANIGAGYEPCVRCASNPGSAGHSWVKAMFVDKTDNGKKIVKDTIVDPNTKEKQIIRVQYIPATVYDNPHIQKNYIFNLLQKPKALREALLYGKWDAFEGQAFPEFTNDPEHYADGCYTHVIDEFDIPHNWPRYVSFDHGYTRPFSFGVWAVDEDGRVYRYKELYGCVPGEANKGVMITPGEIGRQLADLLEPEFREGIHIMGIADPAIWDRSRGESVEEQIRKAFSGVTFMKGDNTRIAGKMQLHERLKFGEDGKPMMYVFSNCREFIRTIPALAYDDKKIEDIDTDGEDHIYDETRYFLMSRPIAPRKNVEKPKRPYHPLLD
ncbi:MAG: phage terminase large subunit [Clostridia bacterium]|nr:phage terminase large subunit [Clostridia bacterium]